MWFLIDARVEQSHGSLMAFLRASLQLQLELTAAFAVGCRMSAAMRLTANAVIVLPSDLRRHQHVTTEFLLLHLKKKLLIEQGKRTSDRLACETKKRLTVRCIALT